MRYLIVFLLIAIFISLGSGLFYLMRDRSQSNRTLQALTWRIGLSVALFVLIAISYHFGWIKGRLFG